MKLVDKDYVPEHVMFDVPENTIIPGVLGDVPTLEKCQELIGQTFVATSVKYTATRYMDVYEKENTRREYQEELEVNQPELDKRLTVAREEFERAKAELKGIEEQYNASNTKVKDLARQVRIGTRQIDLDQSATWRVPLKEQYYFLTYMRGQLVVAGVQAIPDYEKSDLFNSQARNEEAIDKLQQLIAEAV